MYFMKHFCESMADALEYIQETCQAGYVIVSVEPVEMDHYVITYRRV